MGRVTIQIPLDSKLVEKQGQVRHERGKNCTKCSASLTQKRAHHYRYKDLGKNRQVCNFLFTCWSLQTFPSVFTRSYRMVLPVHGRFGKFIHQYQESKRVCLFGGLVGRIVFTEMELGQLFNLPNQKPEAVHLKIDYRGQEGPNIPVTILSENRSRFTLERTRSQICFIYHFESVYAY